MAYSTENTADTGGKTTALTPKEAFQHIKALWPRTEKIVPYAGKSGWCAKDINGNLVAASESITQTIAWLGDDQFPIPLKPWRPATPADVTYPHKECRLRDTANDEWQHAKLIRLAYRSDKIVWVGSQYINFHYWQCEVCD